MFNPYIFLPASHKDREDVVRAYWANVLMLPLEQVRKVIYIKTAHKKVYENRDTYYGTVALRVRKSTQLKYLIKAQIDLVKQHRGEGRR